MTRQYRINMTFGKIVYKILSSTINRKSYNKEEYISRINYVIDHIEKNLDKQLRLSDLSRMANLSKFYFHRIFKAVTGEAINQFIQRLRMEKAASQLLRYPEKPITSISYDCGFESYASFSRIFKEYFCMSPGEWRKSGNLKKSKDGKHKSKNGNAGNGLMNYIKNRFIQKLKIVALAHKKINSGSYGVEIKNLPEITVAYLRYTGPFIYNDDPVYQLAYRLLKWAKTRNLVKFPGVRLIMVYHDRLGITSDSRLRASVCIEVPADTKVGDGIGKMTIPGGRFAVGHFRIPINEALGAWIMMYKEWLPENGYQPDERQAYEIYHSDRRRTKDHRAEVDIFIPIKSL